LLDTRESISDGKTWKDCAFSLPAGFNKKNKVMMALLTKRVHIAGMVVLCLALKLAHYPMPVKQIGNGSQNTHNRVAIRQFPELFLRNLSQETISRIRAKEKLAD